MEVGLWTAATLSVVLLKTATEVALNSWILVGWRKSSIFWLVMKSCVEFIGPSMIANEVHIG